MDQQQKYNEYVTDVLNRFSKDPENKTSGLTKHEHSLAAKHSSGMIRLNRIQLQMNQTRDQVRQAEAQLRSLELQAADTQGKVSGFVEFMISLKFPEVDAAKATELVTPPEPSKAPLPKQRRH